MGEHVVLECLGRAGTACEPPGPPHRYVEGGQGPRHDQGNPAGLQAKHRRREDRALEARGLAMGQGQQGQTAAHRVADGEPWFRQSRLIGSQQGAVVGQKGLVSRRVPRQPILQLTVRQPLAAPVVGEDHIASSGQVLDRFEILLDRLGSASAQDDRAAHRALRGEQRRAEAGAVRAREPLGLAALGNRRATYRNERSSQIRYPSLENRACI